ncbi:MAG: M23 family metallopeptidase [Acidimicrobiia bacterium]
MTPTLRFLRTFLIAAAVTSTFLVADWPTATAHHPQGTDFKSGPDHEYGEMVDYPLVFPLEGNLNFADNFNAWRANNTTHHAIDIMTSRGTPVHAVAAGTIVRINGTRRNSELPGNCCTIVLQHDDGWQSWYWHLNRDSLDSPLCLPDSSQGDGLGWGIADGLEVGSYVDAGQLIGWVGSSGNAHCSSPHLHFELHDPHGVLVNPYNSLMNPVQPGPARPSVYPCTGEDCSGLAMTTGSGQWRIASLVDQSTVSDLFYFGNPGDYQVFGDWNCDGTKTPGQYRQSNGYVYLRDSNTQGNADVSFYFGNPDDIPIVGDFNDDGCDTVSIYRPSNQTFYVINKLGEDDRGLGIADVAYAFGDPGDTPFVGDFDGDGIDTVGLYRESTGLVYYRNTHSKGNADIQFIFGNAGDKIFVGDWNGDGTDTVGVYRPSTKMIYLRLDNSQGPADVSWWVGEYATVVG